MHERTYLLDDGVTKVEVEIEVENWGSSPVAFGPYDSCHDGDPLIAYIVKAFAPGTTDPVELTQAERERMEEAFAAEDHDVGGDDYD